MKRFPLLLAFLLGVARAEEAPKPLIAVSNYPLQWVCETLVGDQATVINLTKDAANPREWVPDDQGLKTLKEADLIVLQGGGYEMWAKDVELPRLFRSSEAVFAKYSEARKLGEEDAALFYPRVGGRAWLDPLHLELQAEAVALQLEGVMDKALLQENLKHLRNALQEMVRELGRNKRLNRERMMTLEPTLAQTLNTAMHWLMFVPDFPEQRPGQIPTLDEGTLNIVERAYLDFPFRMAVTLGEPPLGWEDALQNRWGVWICRFNPGDRPTAGHDSYPSLMLSNFNQLTSGYIR